FRVESVEAGAVAGGSDRVVRWRAFPTGRTRSEAIMVTFRGVGVAILALLASGLGCYGQPPGAPTGPPAGQPPAAAGPGAAPVHPGGAGPVTPDPQTAARRDTAYRKLLE